MDDGLEAAAERLVATVDVGSSNVVAKGEIHHLEGGSLEAVAVVAGVRDEEEPVRDAGCFQLDLSLLGVGLELPSPSKEEVHHFLEFLQVPGVVVGHKELYFGTVASRVVVVDVVHQDRCLH